MKINKDKICIPPELLKIYRDGKLGIFIGAGVSRSAGFPNWKTLLQELINRYKQVNPHDPKRVRDLSNLLKKSTKYLLVAEELKDVLGGDFDKYITERFTDKPPTPSDLHEAIVRLRFRFLITTNYDDLLERAYIREFSAPLRTYNFTESEDVLNSLWTEKPFLLKAHGDVLKPKQGIIITERDYRRILYREPSYRSVLTTLFTTNHVLFLGTSFDDIELNLLLGYVNDAFHGKAPDHYALMSKNGISTTEINRWRKDYNIRIIDYDPKQDHKEVVSFLKLLNRKPTKQ
jgi:hypothetical protein